MKKIALMLALLGLFAMACAKNGSDSATGCSAAASLCHADATPAQGGDISKDDRAAAETAWNSLSSDEQTDFCVAMGRVSTGTLPVQTEARVFGAKTGIGVARAEEMVIFLDVEYCSTT